VFSLVIPTQVYPFPFVLTLVFRPTQTPFHFMMHLPLLSQRDELF